MQICRQNCTCDSNNVNYNKVNAIYNQILKILLHNPYFSSFSSFDVSFRCFFISSESRRASASSDTFLSRSLRSLSQWARMDSLSWTILSRSLKAQSRRRFDTSASCCASVVHKMMMRVLPTLKATLLVNHLTILHIAPFNTALKIIICTSIYIDSKIIFQLCHMQTTLFSFKYLYKQLMLSHLQTSGIAKGLPMKGSLYLLQVPSIYSYQMTQHFFHDSYCGAHIFWESLSPTVAMPLMKTTFY